MKKTTDELLNEIKDTYEIENYIRNNKSEYFSITIHDYLNKLLEDRNLKISTVSLNSGLGDYVYKIFNGSRKGNRDVYIAIGIAMGLSYSELQLLLRLGKYLMLDPRDERDSVFIYAISKKISVMETNEILFNCNQNILGNKGYN